MSWQRRAINAWMRHGVKPVLERAGHPEMARRSFECLAPVLSPALPLTRFQRRSGPVPLYLLSQGKCQPGRVILFLHGGAYLAGSARSYQGMLSRLSRASATEILIPDYRLLQQAPFPAAFDDALACWHHLRRSGYAARDILLAGDSAGGGLALALFAHLLSEQEPEQERPAGLVAFSPWCDLTLSGASVQGNRHRDAIIPTARMQEAVDLYLGGAEPTDARASPLFADFPNPPPVLIQVGDGEVLRSDADRMAARLLAAGGEVHLKIWQDVPHVWQFLAGILPEGQAALEEAAVFVRTAFATASAE